MFKKGEKIKCVHGYEVDYTEHKLKEGAIYEVDVYYKALNGNHIIYLKECSNPNCNRQWCGWYADRFIHVEETIKPETIKHPCNCDVEVLVNCGCKCGGY